MNIQIQRLVIWSRSPAVEPVEIEFALGVVNVITGGSRSGKSAIIPIIDYCLASSDCVIPIDVIRDNASWYGIVLKTNGSSVLIARRVPTASDVSNDFYVELGNLKVPKEIPGPNQNTDGVKVILNDISGVPSFRLDTEEDPRPYQSRLGFRDLMALTFQSQDIVANQNVFFYKTHAHEHRERLKNWFPYILGAANMDTLAARQRLALIEKRLAATRREAERAKQVSARWTSNIQGHLGLARQFGLYSGETFDPTSPAYLIETAKSILANARDDSQPTLEQIDKGDAALRELEKQEEQLSDEIGRLRKRLADIKRLRDGLVGYGNSTQKRADRLQISKWLQDLGSQTPSCPLCGDAAHEWSGMELKKLVSAFEVAEGESRSLSEIPPSFLREEQGIKARLEELLAERRALNRRLDWLLNSNKIAKVQFQRRKNLFMFLGHLEASLENLESIQDSGDLTVEIRRLENERDMLLEDVNPRKIDRRTDAALDEVCTLAHKRLGTLDVDAEYRRVAPKFSLIDLNIKVPSKDGHWHLLPEVGSASNWLSFHVAITCGLQEYLARLEQSCVPSFVIFDQPSQVYFPKVRHSGVKSDNEIAPKHEDEEAVRKIFQTLADSVKESGGKWQCIVLDHADNDIYGGIEGVHEVDVWRNGKKLIPLHWYS